MTDNQLEGLIGELEKATEGGRWLDARIFWTLNPDHQWMTDPGSVRDKRPASYGPLSDTDFETWDQSDHHLGESVASIMGAPRYTTDLNAALALVEEKLPDPLFHMGRIAPTAEDNSESGHRFYFLLPEAEHVSSPNDIEATGNTLPLAICSALLHTLQDKDND